MQELLNAIAKIESIEKQLNAFQEKAFNEIKSAGSISKETESAIEGIGNTQRELGERLLMLEQSGVNLNGSMGQGFMSVGQQFTDSDNYKAFISGSTQKARFEIMANTNTGSDANVAPDRKTGVVPGAFNPLRMETIYPSVPTSSNAIEFTKESSFTNNAAEAVEGGQKAESDIVFTLVNQPVSTVAHWTKISKQLAADNAALAAYINLRMAYGVDRRVETQLAAGNGTAPNISGMLDTGNFTAHGYAAADIGSTLAKLVLIRKMIGDLRAAGYMPNAIVLNPADAATIDTDLLTTNAGQIKINYREDGTPVLWGVPLIEAVGMTADQVAVGDYNAAGTIHDRQSTTVELSESDDTNFQLNLVTIRAERRLALATEVPAAVLAGDLTPA